MQTNKTNSTPLWRELNEARTQGEATFYPKYEGENVCAIITGNVNWCEVMGSYTLDGGITPSEAKANAQYTALSVNNLSRLAEALEKNLGRTETLISIFLNWNEASGGSRYTNILDVLNAQLADGKNALAAIS